MKFTITYQRTMTAKVDMLHIADVKAHADIVVKQFPEGTMKVLSIVGADYVERPCPACAQPWVPATSEIAQKVLMLLPDPAPGAA